jgi:diguanylate cyclase (GGDEF)-like protein/PAS domain S-box-containing protein
MFKIKPTILAIDDTPVNLLTLGAALKHDFDLQIATSGELGLKLALQSPPNLILLDVMMPGIDGFETYERMLKEPSLQDVPVVFITALHDTDTEVKALQLGAVDFITKPIQVETALRRITSLVERRLFRQQVQAQHTQAVQHLAELELRQQQIEQLLSAQKDSLHKLQLAASVFTSAREGILITDLQSRIIQINDAFTRITGYTREDVLGNTPKLLSSALHDAAFFAQMKQQLQDKGHWYGEIWNRRRSGELFASMMTITTVCNDQGEAQNYVGLFSDITTMKAHEAELERIAHFDMLTNLPNRVLLADRLRQGMTQALRRNKPLAVVFLDLDGFKSVNDAHGHEAGDALLVALAQRMKQSLREVDTLARIGGDEFVVLLVDIESHSASYAMLNRLLEAASQAIEFKGKTLQVSASVGVTFFPQTQDIDAEQLLRQADQAMYQAKQSGKNRFHVFDSEHDRSVRSHHASLSRIRLALKQGELILHYQPKVNLRTGTVVGAEALIRWQHPVTGLKAPALFLPVIENDPLAVDVGEWVIDTALMQIADWQAHGVVLPVSVNVGARQLQQLDFVDRLQVLLARHPDVNPALLELEVLETSALEDLNGITLVINRCAALGVRFALDDFGTGYSSLTYLKRLPVAQLKIDQSFVRDMLIDADDMSILKGVIGLSQAFDRSIIAEGVETKAHGARLLELGCELAQGFGIAHPMPAKDFLPWMQSWKPDWQ